MSIAYGLELVLAVAAGLGLVRYAERVAGMPLDLTSRLGLLNAEVYASAGVALVGLAGLLVERARRRSPAHWGLGRWSWAVAGLYAAWVHLVGFEGAAFRGYNQLGLIWVYFYGLREARPSLVPMLLSVWLTARFARLPRDPAPDAREWAGRAFGGFVVVVTAIRLATAR